jgi:hypothetical protein
MKLFWKRRLASMTDIAISPMRKISFFCAGKYHVTECVTSISLYCRGGVSLVINGEERQLSPGAFVNIPPTDLVLQKLKTSRFILKSLSVEVSLEKLGIKEMKKILLKMCSSSTGVKRFISTTARSRSGNLEIFFDELKEYFLLSDDLSFEVYMSNWEENNAFPVFLGGCAFLQEFPQENGTGEKKLKKMETSSSQSTTSFSSTSSSADQEGDGEKSSDDCDEEEEEEDEKFHEMKVFPFQTTISIDTATKTKNKESHEIFGDQEMEEDTDSDDKTDNEVEKYSQKMKSIRDCSRQSLQLWDQWKEAIGTLRFEVRKSEPFDFIFICNVCFRFQRKFVLRLHNRKQTISFP